VRVFETVRSQVHRALQVVDVESIQVLADGPDEVLVVRIPQVVRVGAQTVGGLLEIHGRLPADDAHVVRIGDIKQDDLLAEVAQQCQLSARRNRDVVGGADAVEVLDVCLLLGPIEAQHPCAANQSVEMDAIERHVGTEAFVVHRYVPFLARLLEDVGSLARAGAGAAGLKGRKLPTRHAELVQNLLASFRG
jgi:hypothetical protein